MSGTKTNEQAQHFDGTGLNGGKGPEVAAADESTAGRSVFFPSIDAEILAAFAGTGKVRPQTVGERMAAETIDWTGSPHLPAGYLTIRTPSGATAVFGDVELLNLVSCRQYVAALIDKAVAEQNDELNTLRSTVSTQNMTIATQQVTIAHQADHIRRIQAEREGGTYRGGSPAATMSAEMSRTSDGPTAAQADQIIGLLTRLATAFV